MGWLKDIKKLKWKDLDPTNKNGALAGNLRDLDKQVIQPITEAALNVAFLSIPYAGPLAAAYFAALFNQGAAHQALPLWLKLALKEHNMYDKIDLNKVQFHEGVKGIDGAITIGYDIFFDKDLKLDRPNVDPNHLNHMLHELQHVVQYERGGGVGPVFSKITLQYGLEAIAQLGKLTSGASLKNIHDDANMEEEADRVAADYFDTVWQEMTDLNLADIKDAPRRWTAGGKGHGGGIGSSRLRMQQVNER